MADFIDPTETCRIRFISTDIGDGSVVESAVDRVEITVQSCDTGEPGDFDGDGDVDFEDLITLLSSFGPCGTPCPTDLDGDGRNFPRCDSTAKRLGLRTPAGLG